MSRVNIFFLIVISQALPIFAMIEELPYMEYIFWFVPVGYLWGLFFTYKNSKKALMLFVSAICFSIPVTLIVSFLLGGMPPQ